MVHHVPVLSAAWNPAGGVLYHLRARRYRNARWEGFRSQLASFFDRWHPDAHTLVIVGPSGGYCLPLSIVARFDHLLCFEPDPIARFVLSRRLQSLPGTRSITWVTRDAWIEPILNGRPPPIGAAAGDTAILFSNFVGQLMFLVDEARFDDLRNGWRSLVWPLLERAPWASFHDRLSGPIAPALDPTKRYGARLDDARLLDFYQSHETGELLDHASGELLPAGAQYGYLDWPLMPRQHHLIEAVIGR